MIGRDIAAATDRPYDLAVIGGGIYGAAVTLEAARRGLRPLMVERGDFGGETSWNSLRILHGGLRYLQTADLVRYRASVGERRWFLQHFPDLVEPLPCLMPLYGQGTRRASIFRAAFAVDRCLGFDGNHGLRDDKRLPAGRLLDVEETITCFPAVARGGLRGGALWYDGALISAPRLLIEMLRWAGRCGARMLNYVEAEDLVLSDGRIAGLDAVDRLTGRRLRFSVPLVVNCAGPAGRRLAARFDRDIPDLFQPVLAFNLFLARKLRANAMIAVLPEGGSRYYFLRPWRDGLLLGTDYAPWTDDGAAPHPSAAQIDGLLAAVNRAIPALTLQREHVARVFAGLLPGVAQGSDALASRDVIWNHGAHGGPDGLFSLSGVKLTTARLAAENLLRLIFRRKPLPPYGSEPPPHTRPFYTPTTFTRLSRNDPATAITHIRGIKKGESVVYFYDLLLRRLDWPVATEAEIAGVHTLFHSPVADGTTQSGYPAVPGVVEDGKT